MNDRSSEYGWTVKVMHGDGAQSFSFVSSPVVKIYGAEGHVQIVSSDVTEQGAIHISPHHSYAIIPPRSKT